jgi:hypothetical protein
MLFERQRVLLTLLDALGGQSAHFCGPMPRLFDVSKEGALWLGFICVGNIPSLQTLVNQGFLN